MELSKANTQKLEQYLQSNFRTQPTQTATDRTFDIVSTFAFLIGVRDSVFENPNEAPALERYTQLEASKPARIIRHLCIIRNGIEHNFSKILSESKTNYRSIINMPEYIPQDSVLQLSADGVNVFKGNVSYVGDHLIEINRLIGDRINNCKYLFPTWLNWDYIRRLFLMPDGLSYDGLKATADEFYANMDYYPYGVYMNWPPHDCGNILSSDKKFVTLLYEWNNDLFDQLNKVEDAGDFVTGNIYDFVEAGDKVIFFVDCENSDPYNLCAALMALDETYTAKIDRVILFDDVHTSSAWSILENHISIPVEHILIERVKKNKSLVDITLAMRVSMEFYQNGVDSFVIVSSDSDYWGVISNLPTAKFLVMVEHRKCGPDMREALNDHGIFFCFIDEFHSARSEGIMMDALYLQTVGYIKENLHFNFREMLDQAIAIARVEMSDAEKAQFFDKHIKPFKTSMDQDGNLMLHLKWQ